MNSIFWLVWCPTMTSNNTLNKRFNNEVDAQTEASLLAFDHPGVPFYVMESTALRKCDLTTIDLRKKDDTTIQQAAVS